MLAMAVVDEQAVYQAVREGNVDSVATYLEAGGDPNLCNTGTGRTLLHTASRQGYPAVVSLLLSKGANPGATTLRHLTPLHLACHQGHLKVARLLLEAFAPVDDRDEAGTAPLHLSSQKGHVDVIRLLLQCGADKDALDESGWTPVFFASWKGHAAVTRMLLQAGANARTCDGRDKITPLHLACSWGQLEVAKVLLEFGADSSAKDCNGAFPDGVIGAASPDIVDPACARELSEVVVGHRLQIKGASASLECVVDSLRAKVSELEDQLARAGRDRLEVMAYSSDGNRAKFSAALKPECPVCQVEVKEAVLDPCRHLAACASCAGSLERCPFCACLVQGYQLLESRQVYEHILALEDEGAGLRAQLKRFSRRVRDLVAANGDLKLDVRRARAEILVLNTELRGLEERFLLRTPSPPPTPPARDVAAGSGCANAGAVLHGDGEVTHSEADWVQSGSEVATTGGISCAGTNLDHTILTGGGDHAGWENRLTCAAGDSVLKLRDYVEMADESDDDRCKVTVVVVSGVDSEVSGQHGDDTPGLESSSRSESDVDICCASIDGHVCSRSPRSSHRNAFDSCDSASSECDAQEQPAEPIDGASCGELARAVQVAGDTTDKALELNIGRPAERRENSPRSLSLPSQLLKACFSPAQDVGVASIGSSGTCADSTQSRSTSAPGSFLVARNEHKEAQFRTTTGTPTPESQVKVEGLTALAKYDNAAEWTSSDESSICKVKGMSSASFIADKENAEDMSGDDDKGRAQGMVNLLPLDKAYSTVKRPPVRRRPGGDNAHDILNYFLDDSSQSSSDSRSPGG